MVSLEFSQEPCLTVPSEFGERTDGGHGALHPPSATEQYANLLDNFLLLCY